MWENAPGSPSLRVWLQLVAICTAIPLALTRRLRPLGVTPFDLAILRVLHATTKPMTVGQLVSAVDQVPSSLGTALDQLEQRGWVQRVRDLPDRRTTRVGLTAAGQAKLAEALPIMAATIAHVFGRLTDEDLATLRRLLERVGPDAGAVPAGTHG